MECAQLHHRPAAVGIRATEHQEPAGVGHAAAARDRPGKIPAVIHRQPGIADRAAGAGQAAHGNGAAVLVEVAIIHRQGRVAREDAGAGQPQRAAVDQRRTGVGFVRGQNGRAAAALNEVSRAGDQIRHHGGIAAAERQIGVVGDIPAAEGATGPVGADLQGAAIDERDSAIRIGASQQPGSAVGLDHAQGRAAPVRDDTRYCASRAAAGQNQIGVISAGIRDRTGQGQLAIGHHHRAVALQCNHALHRVAADLVDQARRAVVQEEVDVRRERDIARQPDCADIAGVGGHDLFRARAEGGGTGGHHCAAGDIDIGGERVIAAQGHRAAVDYADAAGADQPIPNRIGIAAGEHQLRVIGDQPGPEQAARPTRAHLHGPAVDDHQAAVGIVAAQHHRERPGRGQAVGPAEDAREGQRAAAGATGQQHRAIQRHVVGDHKAAHPVLGDRRGEADKAQAVTGDELGHAAAGVGQIDLFGDQAGQVVVSGVTAVGGAAKVQDQIRGAHGGNRAVLPLAGRAKVARAIAPGEAVGAGVIEHQVAAAAHRQAPGPVVGVGEAGQIQAERIGVNSPAGGGDGEAVVAVLVEVAEQPGAIAGRQGYHIDHKRIAARGRIRQRAIDLQPVPAAARGAGRAVDLPQVIAAAAQGERPRGRQGPRPGAQARGDRAAALDQHARAAANHQRAGPGQGRLTIGDQQIVLEERRPAHHAEAGGAEAIAHDEVGAVADRRVVDGQRPGVERELAAGIDQEVRRREAATAQRQRAAIDRQIAQGATGAGHGPRATPDLAQRAGATDRSAKIRAPPAEPDLGRVRPHADLARAGQQAQGAVVLEVQPTGPADRDHRRIGNGGHVGPVERAPTGDRQVAAAEQLAAYN